MSKFSKIHDRFDRFRGIKALDVSIEEGTWQILFTADCRESLSAIAACRMVCDVTTFVHATDYYNLGFIVMFDEEHYDKFEKTLREVFKNPDVKEGMERIPGFSALKKIDKRKYIAFVKYLRSLAPDGDSHLPAKELLEVQRYCCKCERELYTLADEVRTILEFDCPAKAYEILDQIVCDRNLDCDVDD